MIAESTNMIPKKAINSKNSVSKFHQLLLSSFPNVSVEDKSFDLYISVKFRKYS